jgi:hypothetical protein
VWAHLPPMAKPGMRRFSAFRKQPQVAPFHNSGSNLKLRHSTTRIILRHCLLAVLLVAAQIGLAKAQYKCSSGYQCHYPGCNDRPCLTNRPDSPWCVNGQGEDWCQGDAREGHYLKAHCYIDNVDNGVVTATCKYDNGATNFEGACGEGENRIVFNRTYLNPLGGHCYCPDPPACAAGNYSSNGKSGGGDYACRQCPSGKFQTATGASVCTDCPANFDSPAGSTSFANCSCAAGFLGPSGGPCAPCPTGTYKDIRGSAAACTPCPLPGQGSPKASAYADNCTKTANLTTTQTGGSHKTQTANWIQIMFFIFGTSLVQAQCD